MKRDIDFAYIDQTDGLTTYPRIELIAAQGMKRLSNLFIKILFTTPGSSLTMPELGGGIKQLLARKFSQSEQQRLISELVSIVEKTKEQIIAQQANQDIDPAAVLKDVKIRNVEFIAPDHLQIELKLINANGDTSDIKVPVVK